MGDRVERLAHDAAVAAGVNRYFTEGRELAGVWLEGSLGKSQQSVLVAAVLLQTVIAKDIAERLGMSARDVLLNVAEDLTELADITDGDRDTP